jgi:hypothetical protein
VFGTDRHFHPSLKFKSNSKSQPLEWGPRLFANIRQGWRCLAMTNTQAFQSCSQKKFHNFAPKTFILTANFLQKLGQTFKKTTAIAIPENF